jgi:hypothetical protein
MTTDKNNAVADPQPAGLAEQQVGEVQGDARSLAEHITDHLCHHEYDIGGRSELLACVAEALAARQPGAQEQVAYMVRWRSAGGWGLRMPNDMQWFRDRADEYEIRDLVFPPAQGIDLGKFRGWLCTTTDGVATDWTMEEDSRARFERMGRSIEPVFAAGPDVQRTRQDYLLDRRNWLMNSYGNGDREDAAIDAQSAQVGAELALIDQRDAAPGGGQWLISNSE